MQPYPKRLRSSQEEVLGAQQQAAVGMAPSPRRLLVSSDSLGEFFSDPEAFDPHSNLLQGPCDPDKNSVLILAVKGGHDAAFDLIVQYVRDSRELDYQNGKGVTALAVAAHKGRERMAAELLKRGASVNVPNHNGSTALIQAAHFGHLSIVELLACHRANVDSPNHKGTTALMRAAQEGHVLVVHRLLCHPCDVNARNEDGMNALMLASQRGHANIVSLLISYRAAIDGRTVQGSTALMLACKRGHYDVVKTLLSAGAELAVKDSKGRVALDQAVRRGQRKILHLLRGGTQLTLMRGIVAGERTRQLLKLFVLTQQGRAVPVPSVVLESRSLLALARLIGFRVVGPSHHESCPTVPMALFRHICEFLPLPRIWKTEMERQSKRIRVHNASDAAIQGSFNIINEVFDDWQPPRLHLTSRTDRIVWLVRVARNPHLQDLLLNGPRPIPMELLAALVTEHDLQSLLARRGEGVSCDSFTAKHICFLAKSFLAWYQWHECPGMFPSPDLSPLALGRVPSQVPGSSQTGLTSANDSESEESDG
mmetsp:Transcript_17920/g.52380  ORF Transcript_17920/g.52380 Transcript_17920/m.52380 type:complete len:538 (-) Transcript_17920:109-1722(-)